MKVLVAVIIITIIVIICVRNSPQSQTPITHTYEYGDWEAERNARIAEYRKEHNLLSKVEREQYPQWKKQEDERRYQRAKEERFRQRYEKR